MEIYNRLLLSLALGLLLVIACREEFHPLSPPPEPGKTELICPGTPIRQNIIGSWQVGIRRNKIGDTLARSVPVTSSIFTQHGTLNFTATNRVSDPNLLLPTEIDLEAWKPFLYYTYSIETDTRPNGPYSAYGELVWLNQMATIQGQPSRATGYLVWS